MSVNKKNQFSDIFSERLAALMGELNIKQKQLAEAVGVAQASVSGWLNGSVAGGAELYRLAKFFDMPMEFFLDPEPEDRGRPLELIREMPISQLSGTELERVALSEMTLSELVDFAKNTEVFARPKIEGAGSEKNTETARESMAAAEEAAGVSSSEHSTDPVIQAVRRVASKLHPSPALTPKAPAPSAQSGPPSRAAVLPSSRLPSPPVRSPKK